MSNTNMLSIEALNPSQDDNSVNWNDVMMQNEMQSIEQDIKDKIQAMWKAGVSYVIIVEYALDALGIQQSTQVIKAVTQVQDLLNKVNGDLNDLEKILQEIQGLGLGQDWYMYKDGAWVDSGLSVADNPDPPPGCATVQQQMTLVIEKFLYQSNDCGITDSDGNALDNAQTMQALWKDLFGDGSGNDTSSLVYQLQAAMNNPWYKQDSSSINALATLNGDSIFGGLDPSEWTANDKVNSFVDFLQGKDITQYDSNWYNEIAEMMAKAFANSYYANNNIDVPDNQGSWLNGTTDYIGAMTGGFDSVVQAMTALNQTQSTVLTTYAQTLTSYVNEGQQMIQQNTQAMQMFVQNQKAQ